MSVSRRFFLVGTCTAIAFGTLDGHLYGLPLACRLTVKASGVRNNTGSVIIGVWNSKDGFPKDRAKAVRQASVLIVNATAVAVFSDMPYGEYGVALFHDENSNGKMDSRFPGIPTEGIGSSNNPHPRFSAPTFSDCRVELLSPEKTVEITMLY